MLGSHSSAEEGVSVQDGATKEKFFVFQNSSYPDMNNWNKLI